jgi:hypothetical protein
MRHRVFFFFCSGVTPAAIYIRPPHNIIFLLHTVGQEAAIFCYPTRLSIVRSIYATASVPSCTRSGIKIQIQKKKNLGAHPHQAASVIVSRHHRGKRTSSIGTSAERVFPD